jgi:demethylmenaquinone methyltransferase/2-methoxy-6-polyprenyl-1,4-benzoquinol methylase
MFSRIAGTYDQLNTRLSMGKDKQWRKDSVKQLLSGGFKPKIVLDLCAGTGDFTLALVTDDMYCKVVMVDFSREMLKLARGKTRGVSGRVTLLEADALKIPIQDMSFDAAMCGFGIRNLDSAEAGLKEIVRVLKPGAKVVILEFFKPQGALLNLFYSFYMKFVVAKAGSSISKDSDAYQYLPSSARSFLSPADFGRLMEKCGFKDISVESRTMGIALSFVGTRK